MPNEQQRARPPGPGLAQLGIIAARVTNPTYTLLPEIARRYGDVVDIPVPAPGWTMTLVSHPDHVDHIMTRRHWCYAKHESTRELFFDEPLPLPLLVGEEWKRTRRELSPRFADQALRSVGVQMVTGLTARVAAWTDDTVGGRPMELQDELGVVVMDGLMRSMFGMALPTAALQDFATATRDYARYVMWRTALYFLPRLIPRPSRQNGERAKRHIFAQLDEFIVRREQDGPQDDPDVLDILLGMPFEGSAQERYSRVRSELCALVLAGIDTTTAALGWAVALLFANPPALARAYEEVDALGGAPLEYAHTDRLQYLRCCFDEAQRIQSATPANIRTATEDDEIGGYRIPAGSHVLISPYGLHRDPRFWNGPEHFRPDRFVEDQINRNAFVPFNVGPRKCMGYRLANAEGALTLAAILQHYYVTLRPEWQPRHELRGATGISGGLPVTVTRRASAPRR